MYISLHRLNESLGGLVGVNLVFELTESTSQHCEVRFLYMSIPDEYL